MKIIRREITLRKFSRGFHIITDDIISSLPEIEDITSGIMNIFLKHTSASLSLNENADPSVRRDMEKYFNKLVPEDADYFEHIYEGSDDMTSHIKSSLLGASLTIPVYNGRPDLGQWQGVYLCEHRNNPHPRKITVTLIGI
jgi:secondary thiamine-phosphate synthase enzyme